MVATELEKAVPPFLASLERLQIITTLISTWISGFQVCQAKGVVIQGREGRGKGHSREKIEGTKHGQKISE